VLPIRTKPFLINLGEEIKLLSLLVHSFEAKKKSFLAETIFIYDIKGGETRRELQGKNFAVTS